VGGDRSALALFFVAAALAVPATAEAQLRLRDCDEGRCGTLSVPLDPSGARSGKLALRVQIAPPRRRPRRGATVLLSGGPGQGGISAFAGPSFFPDEWAATWQGLTPRNAIVAFDQRGTGAGALRCRDLEEAAASDLGREAEACAFKLAGRRRFFRTAESIADLEALRAALGVEKLTIVGASYGTYVAQRYALVHPDRVQRLVLDSVLDATGVDPLYLDTAAAASRVLHAYCTPECRSFTRNAPDDTRELVERLAGAPLRGAVVDANGRRRAAFLTRQELLLTLMAGDLDPLSRSDYPAAVVSALRGDTAPLMRLKRRAISSESPGDDARSFSAATYAATTCEEIRFPWEWHASPGERAGALGRVEAELDPALAFPFDPGTLVRNDTLRLCRRWPTLSAGPPSDPGPMPDVPVLLLNGTEDLRTPLESARRAAARFPRAQLVPVSGAGHSVIGFGDCAHLALTRFFMGQSPEDACAGERPAFEPARPVPASLAEVVPARGVPGPRGRVVRAVALTFGDMFEDLSARLFAEFDLAQGDEDLLFRGSGLRGGSYRLTERSFTMKRLEYVPGVTLSARVAGGAEDGPVRLRVNGPRGLDGKAVLSGGDGLRFEMRGRIGGLRFKTRILIPVRALLVFIEDEGGGVSGAAALRWLPCVRQWSSSSRRWPWPLYRPPMRRCASSAAGRTASPARG
jgi:pimeloyl-ACP methyl ester carboxylesterase